MQFSYHFTEKEVSIMKHALLHYSLAIPGSSPDREMIHRMQKRFTGDLKMFEQKQKG
jgi:hypothetical protein